MIGVVFNPRSRKNLRDRRAIDRLARTVGDLGVVREARTIDELYRIAEDYKALGVEVLGISGGDGTNHVTLTGFIDVYGNHALPLVAFLRGGTMNTVANSVGIRRGRPDGLLAALTRVYAERASRPLVNVERHVIRIGKTYGFLFGTGAVYGFLAEYYRMGEPSPIVAARTLLRGAASAVVGGDVVRRIAEPFRGKVFFDDGTEWPERDYLAVAGGAIEHIGLNFRPFHRASTCGNAFHLLGIHASPMAFVRDLPRIWRGVPMRDGNAYESAPSHAVIHSSDGVMRYMVDGDLHETKGPLDVSIGPRVRILANY